MSGSFYYTNITDQGREPIKDTYEIHSDLQAASLEREEAITKPQPNEQNELSY